MRRVVTSVHCRTSRRMRVFPAVLMVALVSAPGIYYFLSPSKLADRDTIVLADFTNTTGDPVFDGTLRRGLAVALGQSPFLNLIPDEKLPTDLGLMDQPAGARLTPKIARDICERVGTPLSWKDRLLPWVVSSCWVCGLRTAAEGRSSRTSGFKPRKGSGPDRTESNCQQVSNEGGRIVGHGRKTLDTPSQRDDSVDKGSESL